MAWLRAARQRRTLAEELAKLSDEQLRDIGVDRAVVAGKIEIELARMDLRRLGSIGLR